MGFQRSRNGWDHNSAGEEMEAFDPVLTWVHAGTNSCERSGILKQQGAFIEAVIPLGEGKRF